MRPARRAYIDWLRGLAILIMIEAHVVDSWTRAADRTSPVFGWAIIIGGFGAPLFLFLAGLSVVLSASTKQARGADVAGASRAVQRRGWEIFGLAFLFRLQAIVLNPGAPWRGLLKVDILNIMGPAIVASAAIWGRARTNTARLAAFLGAAAVVTFLTPLVRVTPLLDWFPDPVEWYFRPQPGRSTFTLFPWAGFLFMGSVIGVAIVRRRQPAEERRLHLLLLAAGLAMAYAGYRASFLPPIYAESNFWTTSPTFFFMRNGILIAGLGAVFFWERRPFRTPIGRYAPMERFGRSSLFVYWIHVEMVYGWFSLPLHKALSLGGVAVALVLFTLFLFGLVVVKQSLSARLARGKAGPGSRGDLRAERLPATGQEAR